MIVTKESKPNKYISISKVVAIVKAYFVLKDKNINEAFILNYNEKQRLSDFLYFIKILNSKKEERKKLKEKAFIKDFTKEDIKDQYIKKHYESISILKQDEMLCLDQSECSSKYCFKLIGIPKLILKNNNNDYIVYLIKNNKKIHDIERWEFKVEAYALYLLMQNYLNSLNLNRYSLKIYLSFPSMDEEDKLIIKNDSIDYFNNIHMLLLNSCDWFYKNYEDLLNAKYDDKINLKHCLRYIVDNDKEGGPLKLFATYLLKYLKNDYYFIVERENQNTFILFNGSKYIEFACYYDDVYIITERTEVLIHYNIDSIEAYSKIESIILKTL